MRWWWGPPELYIDYANLLHVALPKTVLLWFVKDVVVYRVDSVGVGIPVNVPLHVDVEVVENPTNHSNTVWGKETCNKFD
jgi:uncharacterized membrane protein